MANPLSQSEKGEIRRLANRQYAISRTKKDLGQAEFYRGRAVGMGKVAQMYNPTGYRCGIPEEEIAWKALDFEYSELGNEHILEDVSRFIGIEGDWRSVLSKFRERFGNRKGIWICSSMKDANRLYGSYGRPYPVEYDAGNVVARMPDGIFVLDTVIRRNVMRVTKADMLGLVEYARGITGLPMIIEWAYGKPRVMLHIGEYGGVKVLSPRLPSGQMYDWIHAFLDGFDYGYRAGASKTKKRIK